MAYYGWKPYVPVAKRRAKAAREMKKRCKAGKKIEPVEILGRKIANTFWGEAWCNHLERFSDYANRLPRGRTYVRNGSVCHLGIAKGRIEATVSGSELYDVEIRIEPLSADRWETLRKRCTGKIGSMLELLQGRFSDQVMQVVTNPDSGLFPKPDEITLSCSCPDWADMCKHVAAVLYGVGAHLDRQPELLFRLRDVDHEALITAELDLSAATSGSGGRRRIESDDLSSLFGVEIDASAESSTKGSTGKQKRKRKTLGAATKGIAIAKTKKGGQGSAHGRQQNTRPSNAGEEAAFTPTAKAIADLRRRFGMNKAQFARLLCVTPPTVTYWENAGGRLNLRRQTMEIVDWAAGLTAEQARKELRKSER